MFFLGGIFFFLAFDFFVGSVLSFVFFIPPQRPMTSDFEGFLYQISSITLFSYLISWERASISLFNVVLNKGTTGTIFITSLVWRDPWLGIEPGTSPQSMPAYKCIGILTATYKVQCLTVCILVLSAIMISATCTKSWKKFSCINNAQYLGNKNYNRKNWSLIISDNLIFNLLWLYLFTG